MNNLGLLSVYLRPFSLRLGNYLRRLGKDAAEKCIRL